MDVISENRFAIDIYKINSKNNNLPGLFLAQYTSFTGLELFLLHPQSITKRR